LSCVKNSSSLLDQTSKDTSQALGEIMKTLSLVILLGSSLSAFGFHDSSSEIEVVDHGLEDVENIQVIEQELFDFTSEKSFPSNRSVRAYDPVNRVSYENVIVGPSKRAGFLKDYDFWRYVTVYNKETVKERISYLPYFYEECHDDSWRLGGWDESRTVSVTMSSEIGIKDLGLSMSVGVSVTEGITFSFSRAAKGTAGIEAKHFPYKISETWTGVTYIQTYKRSTNTFGYLRPSIMDGWTNGYPYDFELDNQNVGFRAEREVIRTCEGYDPSKDGTVDSDLYFN
tara:strand:- start:6494 stop:7348 length:855 start_codon:yes stop_codon:yes gene_type:complete